MPESAKNAIRYAIEFHSESEPSLSRFKLLKTALTSSDEKLNVAELISAIHALKDTGELITVANSQKDPVYLTKELIDREKNIITTLVQSCGTELKIAPKERNLQRWMKLHASHLSVEQKNVLSIALQSSDRILAIEGSVGSGKTSLIKPISQYCERQDYVSIALVATKKQKEQLESSQNVNVLTISGYIKKTEKLLNIAKSQGRVLDHSNHVFVLDDAHRLSNKQVEQLNTMSKKTGARLIYLYDEKQPGAIQVGSATSLFKKAGIVVSHMRDNFYKQKHNMQQAISRTLASNVSDSLEKISGNIHEHTIETQPSEIANHYSELYKQGISSVIVTSTKMLKAEQSLIVREKLKKQSLLGATDTTVTTLSPVAMRKVQFANANQYKRNTYVRFNYSYKKLNVEKGHYYKIVDVDSKKNEITLLAKNGEYTVWNPAQIAGKREGALEIFTETEQKISIGEKILFTRAYNSKLTANDIYTVEKITNQSMQLLNDKTGKKTVIKHDDRENTHFEHAYAITNHQLHHYDVDVVIGQQHSYHQFHSQKSFYQLLSQARVESHIYTENKAELVATITKRLGDKSNAVDILLKGKQQEVSAKEMPDNIDKETTHLKKKHPKDASYSKIPGVTSKKTKTAIKQAVKHCANELFENESVISRYELEQKVIKHTFSEFFGVSSINKAIDSLIDRKDLITCALGEDTGLTTRRIIKMEAKVLQYAKRDQGKLTPILSDDKQINDYLDNYRIGDNALNNDQKAAINFLLQSKDKYGLIHGIAGVGKSTLLAAAKPIVEERGYKIVTLAPTHRAASILRGKGLEAYTLDKYISNIAYKIRNNELDKSEKVLLIPDESSMVATNRFHKLMSLLDDTAHRVNYIGDTKQLPAVELGKMFGLFENAGVNSIHVEKIIRQRDNPYLLDIIKKLYAGKFSTVIQQLHKDGFVYDNKQLFKDYPDLEEGDSESIKEARIDKLVSDEIKLAPEHRRRSIVMTPSNKDRVQFNEKYREALQEEGSLASNNVPCTILEKYNIQKTNKEFVAYYPKQSIVRFNQKVAALGIKKDEYLTVTDVNSQANIITLENKDGQQIPWNPQLNGLGKENLVSVYVAKDRQLSIGDEIIWRDTNQQLSRKNMETATVTDITDNKAEVKLASGKLQQLNLHEDKHQHWDHAYAKTAYALQGSDDSFSSLLLDSSQRNLASQPTFIVALTRAIISNKLYIDDPDKLAAQITFNKGEKTCALEAIGYVKNQGSIQKKEPTIEKTLDTKHQTKPVPTRRTFKQYDYKEVTNLMSLDAENISTLLLGEPKSRSGKNLYFGSNQGSLAVTLTGEHAGCWTDFDTGEGGHLFQLYQKELGLNFKDTLEYCARLVNATTKEIDVSITKKQEKTPTKPKVVEFTEYEKKRIAYAQKLAAEAKPIKGSLIDKYIKETRGISIDKYSNDTLFHPGIYTNKNGKKLPAFLTISRDEKGKIQRLQAIFIDPKTKDKANVKVKKFTIGPAQNAIARVDTNTHKSSTAIICEGPEDAIALSKSLPKANVYTVLGKMNFGKIPTLKGHTNIIFALDNDGKKVGEMSDVIKNAKRQEKHAQNVWLAQPNNVKDINDALKLNGEKEVRNIIANGQHLSKFTQSKSKVNQSFYEHIKQSNIDNSRSKKDVELSQKSHKDSHNLTKQIREKEIEL